jgi:hypothetical protein
MEKDPFHQLLSIKGEHIWCCGEDISEPLDRALVSMADKSVRSPSLEERMHDELSTCLEWWVAACASRVFSRFLLFGQCFEAA